MRAVFSLSLRFLSDRFPVRQSFVRHAGSLSTCGCSLDKRWASRFLRLHGPEMHGVSSASTSRDFFTSGSAWAAALCASRNLFRSIISRLQFQEMQDLSESKDRSSFSRELSSLLS